jgi:hypothetical protein
MLKMVHFLGAEMLIATPQLILKTAANVTSGMAICAAVAIAEPAAEKVSFQRH